MTLDITSIRATLTGGGRSITDVTEAALGAAERTNDQLSAFLQIGRKFATDRAIALDGNGAPDSPLAGVPIAIKDNICVRGLQTSCGSRILGDYQPPYDATAVDRLNAAGAIVIGKT
ncbi:MAG: amidase family protein, partial [Pyrinomonadaceae bacterium]